MLLTVLLKSGFICCPWNDCQRSIKRQRFASILAPLRKPNSSGRQCSSPHQEKLFRSHSHLRTFREALRTSLRNSPSHMHLEIQISCIGLRYPVTQSQADFTCSLPSRNVRPCDDCNSDRLLIQCLPASI